MAHLLNHEVQRVVPLRSSHLHLVHPSAQILDGLVGGLKSHEAHRKESHHVHHHGGESGQLAQDCFLAGMKGFVQ